MKTYAEALAYLYSFTNYELAAMTPRTDMRLNRMRALLTFWGGQPQERFRSVLIAGTKGKGSTAAMVASMAHAAGLRTGLYSTPHLNTHRERMRIDGQLIPRDEFVERMRWVRRMMDDYAGDPGPPTTYELGTVLAFQFFADHNVDLAVVEVGLGGRLDATNVLDAEVSAFASISYDHVEVLGRTLTAIATEKAGIVKPGKPVVTEPQTPEVMDVLERAARQKGAPLTIATTPSLERPPVAIVAGEDVDEPTQCFSSPTACIRLLGEHQLANAGLAMAIARQIGLGEAAIVKGLEAVRWPGRLEILQARPLVIADGAHNVDSMEKLAAAVRRHFRYDRLRVIAGFSADKDILGMAGVLNDLADDIVLIQSKHPRAARPEDIAEYFHNVRIARDLGQALAKHGDRELALITGSLYLVGEARLHLGLVAPEDQDPL